MPPFDEVFTLEQSFVGSIEVGKKADLIPIDQNLFEIEPEKNPHTTILATMFDGNIVHDVVYALGDCETVELEGLGEGAVGSCRDEDSQRSEFIGAGKWELGASLTCMIPIQYLSSQ